MQIKIYQVDAFTDQVFKGNPAAVCPLESWLDDEILLSIALENNLSETAFYINEGQNFQLRWFTPGLEVDLCGHATLATAHVLFEHENYHGEQIHFSTRSGILSVTREDDFYAMNFPADELVKIPTPPVLKNILKTEILETFQGKTDYLVILPTQESVEQLTPDFRLLGQLKKRGLIATAPGTQSDFVSRCFYTPCGVDEDPVTGSAHTTMTPYWAKQLGKENLTAFQLSKRKGFVQCHYQNDRVILKGKAVTYLTGDILI